MTLKEFLKHPVVCDSYGIVTIKTKDDNGNKINLASIGAWNEIKQMFPTQKECEDFQEQLGKFIAEAIEKHKHTLK